MMMEDENREPRQRAAREHIEHVQDAAALSLEQLRQLCGIDARDRDVRADAVDNQCPKQKQQPPLEVREASGPAAE
jgi:hypothetical protein